MSDFTKKKCKPCEGQTQPMSEDKVRDSLQQIPGWEYSGGQITRVFEFKNYYQTAAFVNAAIWIAHQEDHHPDITFGYKKCEVIYSTHSIGGISENDFICAAKINELVS